MSANYLYQIVYCSQRKGRAFRREIAISSNSAMVTNVEMLPPGYDMALDRMRNPNESVYSFAGDLKTVRDDIGCPFCGNKTTFTCLPEYGGCGTISCQSRDHNGHHCCPGCDVVHRAVPTDRFLVSGSGFVDGRTGATQQLAGAANRLLEEQNVSEARRQQGRWDPPARVIDGEIVESQKRIERLLLGPQNPLVDGLLRRGLPAAPKEERKTLSGLPWTKLLLGDGSDHGDDEDRPHPDPPPRRLLGDGNDTSSSEDRLAKLSDNLNRHKR